MEYNKIFNQLVSDEHDPEQVFAYCVYKKRKIAYIEKRKAEKIVNGKNPEVTYKEVNDWVDKLTESDLNSFRKDGGEIVSKMHSSLVQEAIEKEKNKILGDLVEEIKSKRFKDYAKDVMIGVLSSIIASMVFTKCSSSEPKQENLKEEQTTNQFKESNIQPCTVKTAKHFILNVYDKHIDAKISEYRNFVSGKPRRYIDNTLAIIREEQKHD